MATNLTEQEFSSILDRALRTVTCRMGQMQLFPQPSKPSEEMCAVSTTFEGDFCGTLILCMEPVFLRHLTREVLDSGAVTFQDMVDTAKEFFNVFCGSVAAGLFQSAGLSTRFCIPQFCCGCADCTPESCRMLFYTSCSQGGLQLIHHFCPLSPTV